MNTLKDILKENITQMGLVENLSIQYIALVLGTAFVCGIVLYLVYKLFYQGAVYSENFGLLIVMTTLTVAFIIMTISSNIVLSLGMVGALSIVRFRTAVKDPLDVGFLFLARAILAGYNCSNVDVRSSRYDAVIDKGGKLFRVQIKGISGNTVSIKDRDRGGRGIDSTNQHNKGKRITSKDCEIYVAVDRQTGICYIIPTTHIDKWTKDQKNVKDLAEYKENWKAIDELGQ